MKPEITSNKILSILSNQWLNVNKIVNNIGIEDSLDKKYLQLKLKELYRNGKIEYVYHIKDIYWKVNKFSESGDMGLSIDFYSEMVYKDPSGIESE